ncbi:MAG: phosphonate ABC transporter, permease protein PhnE [Actinomycetota bacterium]
MTATLPSDTEVPDDGGRPEYPTSQRNRRWALAVLIAVFFVWGVSGLDISIDRLRSAPGDAWNITRQMWPPDFATVIDRGVIGKIFESVYIAWVGTLIGAAISLPLAFLASNNITPAFIRLPVRQLFNVIRAVPELIIAMVLLSVVPLGPWAGTLALGFNSVGTLGKLSSEEIENADRGPVEAVEACGGRWVSAVRWGMLPQVMPVIASYWLFRFEINVRASAVLGLIGAGGVGGELVAQLNFRNFPEVGAVLIMTIAVVVFIDIVSASVRRRIITGSAPDQGSRTVELLRDLTGRRD